MHSENPSTSIRFIADPPDGRLAAAAFRLDGPTRFLDSRINAYRSDIADVALAGSLFAPHYAAPLFRSAAESVMMRAAPEPEAEAVSQLLTGEGFAVLDVAGGWAWGYSRHDHYVGYVPDRCLTDMLTATHRIAVREALLFARPSIKSPAMATLPFGALVAGTMGDTFLQTPAGFIHRRHVCALDDRCDDAASVAELLLGSPYLWGGRGAGGIDCSGLVQIALAATGIDAPRDTDLQRTAIGRPIADEEDLRRGDVVFFPGHVGLMVDDSSLIHANAHWMSVVAEPLADVVARLIPHHDRPITSRRRLPR